jgi:hypothetical protein
LSSRAFEIRALLDRIVPKHGHGGAPFTLPPSIIEIEPGFVVAGRLEGMPRPRLRSIAMQPLGSGALQPSASLENVKHFETVLEAMDQVAELAGHRGSRVGVLVPDPVMRVSILTFESLPSRLRDLKALVCWRMKDSLPFPADEARLSYQILKRTAGQVEMLAVVARDSVVSEYEHLGESLGSNAVLVLPATMALLPLIFKEDSGADLLIHLCADWVTSVMIEKGLVRFWRTRTLDSDSLDQRTHDLTAEVARAAASVKDRFQVENTRVWLSARPAVDARLEAELCEAVGTEIQPLPTTESYWAGLGVEQIELGKTYGATFAGLVANQGSA